MHQENSIFQKPFSYLLTIKNIVIKFPEKVINFIKSHKQSTQTNLLVNPIINSSVLSFLPFVLGFYIFLNQKYSKEKTFLFFEKNLPKISIPTENIEWDTFQYVLNEQTKLDDLVKEIYWSDKDLIFEIASTKGFIPKIENNLITFFKLDPQKKGITKIYFFELLKSKSDFYKNLDEIPVKLQGLYSTKTSNTFLPISNILIQDSNKINQQVYTLLEKNLHFKNLIGVKFNDQGSPSAEHQPSKIIFNKQKKFLKIEQISEYELRKLFTNTGLIPNFNFKENPEQIKLEKIFQKKFSKTLELQNLQELIREIDNRNISNSLTLTRLMSGYKYPDMKINQIINFLCQEKDSQVKNIRIILPSSFLLPQAPTVKHIQPPTFLINSKKVILTDPIDQNVNLYDGPGILINKKTGFDWKIFIENDSTKVDLQDWIENYLGLNNPLSDSLKNFFGVLESPENNFSNQVNLIENKKEVTYWFKNLSVFRTGIISNTTPSYFKFERSFYLPFISNLDWQNQLTKTTELNSLQLNTAALPILETRIPQSNSPKLLFGYKNAVDFKFENPFSKKSKDSFALSFIPANFTYLGQEYFQIPLSSGVYQKIPSLFGENSLAIFDDLWEPLTFKSWLVTSQIGFAFLVFNILKALADNYGRELLVYLLDLVALLGFLDDDLKQEIEILMGQREKGFRIISKTTKNFSNVGGIQTLLPEIVEIVWFLRNEGREFSISKTLPRGVLLSGPPGTGKTLLVQAIAGEAEVPVLALSGSSLLEPGESGALKLEILFQEARRLAPCIVFIDEMDTLAQKREQVLQDPMGADEILEFLSNISLSKSHPANITEKISETVSLQQDMHKEKLRILMQFLVELDGIQGRDGVVVIGATNRPEMLDPAVLRPGRFDRVLEIALPGPEKRKEILKLYSNNLGIDNQISWNYLINLTAGYSAADLASIMNQSSLNAIVKQTHHTIETIEYGIDRITTIGFDKPFNTRKNQLSVSTIQLAYYQAGKILVSALLEHHPPTLVTHLWPRRANTRALQISQNLQKYFFRFARRVELEHRVVGCYAGKAAEILFLQNFSLMMNVSDLGFEDIQFGQNLIKSMVEYWYLYGKTISLEKNLTILNTNNSKEYRDYPDKIPFFNSFIENLEFSNLEQLNNDNKTIENSVEQRSQKYFSSANWQYQISNEFELATRTFSDWYRLYLPDPQQTERNLEWTPPDEFYHGNNLLEELTETNSLTWNDLEPVHINYQMQSLILQSFNKSLSLVDQNREILDKLVYELIHCEILRQPEIDSILAKFNINKPDPVIDFESDKFSGTKTISSSWGENSRRDNIQFINLDLFQK